MVPVTGIDAGAAVRFRGAVFDDPGIRGLSLDKDDGAVQYYTYYALSPSTVWNCKWA